MNIGDIIAIDEVRERVEDDLSLYLELCTTFLEDSVNSLIKVRTALTLNNSEEVKSIAHSMKGALANLGAMKASSVAMTIEFSARSGDLSSCATKVLELERELDSFSKAVELISAKGSW